MTRIGFSRRLFALAALGSVLCSGVAYAQTAEPLKLIVPYVAGASTDTLARMVGQDVGETMKRPVVAENITGAAGMIAATHVKRLAGDPNVFMLSTDGILSVNPSIYKKIDYDPVKDFTPLSIAVAAPIVLAVRTDSQFKSAQQLIDFAKSNPDKLSYGSAGMGSSQHMAGELMKAMAGVKINHVPYRGGAQAMNDLLGGHIDMMFVQSASAKGYNDTGKLRILAVGSPQRIKLMPEVPTFDEVGLKGYDSDTWYGFSMPSNIDPKAAAALSAAIAQSVVKRREQLEKLGYTVVASSPQAMAKSVDANLVKWRDISKQIGIYQTQ
jgi:tripartite-type tricarboxylate transporter receptor subunit TctC